MPVRWVVVLGSQTGDPGSFWTFCSGGLDENSFGAFQTLLELGSRRLREKGWVMDRTPSPKSVVMKAHGAEIPSPPGGLEKNA